MSERVYQAVGIGLAFVVAIVALISFANRDGWDAWWLPVVIAGILVGAWWTIGGIFLQRDDRDS